MVSEFWITVEDAFHKATLLRPENRDAYLAKAYSDNSEIKREIESLLRFENPSPELDGSLAGVIALDMLRDSDNLIGTVIGERYAIRCCIGSGANGEVYLADHITLDAPFALKRPHPAFRNNHSYRLRLVEEARRAVHLKHDNVTRVHDVLDHGGDIFVVMEYVEGETLRARMNRLSRPFTIDEFLPIARQCVSALAAAHEKRIVHLDVKPENIMITSAGQVKLCDFGLARQLALDEAHETSDNSETKWRFAGTPAYMAPEVILRQNFDERADLFSLGTVFYEMLTGHNPFRAESVTATTARVVYETPPPISCFQPNTNLQLDRVVRRLLMKDPDERGNGTTELLRNIQAVTRSHHRLENIRRHIAFTDSRLLQFAAATALVMAVAIPLWNHRANRRA